MFSSRPQCNCTPVGMNTPSHKIVGGTSYHQETPDTVISVLEAARQSRTRLHISLGDTTSGKDWLEEFETHGYVGGAGESPAGRGQFPQHRRWGGTSRSSASEPKLSSEELQHDGHE